MLENLINYNFNTHAIAFLEFEKALPTFKPWSNWFFLVYYSDSLISWPMKKQSTVSRTSTKFEYHAIKTTMQELEWV